MHRLLTLATYKVRMLHDHLSLTYKQPDLVQAGGTEFEALHCALVTCLATSVQGKDHNKMCN